MSEQETRRAVEGYFTSWTANEIERAESWLAEDLHFAGPNASYSSAAEFHPALVRFAAMTKSATIVELIVSGDRAALLYDCDLAPFGVVRISSFFRVERGKISWYETFFDPTKLSPPRS